MRIAITLTVDRVDAGRTLHDWLAFMLVDETPASVMAAIREGRVAVDRQPVTDPEAPLTAGAEVSFQEAPLEGAAPSPPAASSRGELARVGDADRDR